MKRFKVGDSVIVCMARNDCFAFQAGVSPKILAQVAYTPQDTGDLWGFRTLAMENMEPWDEISIPGGIDFRLNPVAADFIGLEPAASPTNKEDGSRE